jgi:hypothetical protein
MPFLVLFFVISVFVSYFLPFFLLFLDIVAGYFPHTYPPQFRAMTLSKVTCNTSVAFLLSATSDNVLFIFYSKLIISWKDDTNNEIFPAPLIP